MDSICLFCVFNNSICGTLTKFTDKWKGSKNQTMTFCRPHFLFKQERRQLLLMHQTTLTS